jgi:hypothetical protein
VYGGLQIRLIYQAIVNSLFNPPSNYNGERIRWRELCVSQNQNQNHIDFILRQRSLKTNSPADLPSYPSVLVLPSDEHSPSKVVREWYIGSQRVRHKFDMAATSLDFRAKEERWGKYPSRTEVPHSPSRNLNSNDRNIPFLGICSSSSSPALLLTF